MPIIVGNKKLLNRILVKPAPYDIASKGMNGASLPKKTAHTPQRLNQLSANEIPLLETKRSARDLPPFREM